MALEFTVTSSIPTGEEICDQQGGEVWLTRMGVVHGDFLTINSKDKTVKWYGPGGNEVKRVYHLSKLPTMAIFCYLQVSLDLHKMEHSSVSPHHATTTTDRQLAIAVLTNEDILHVFMYTGEHFDIILPSVMEKIVSTPFGLVLQSQDVTAAMDFDAALGMDGDSSNFDFLQHLSDTEYSDLLDHNILSPSVSKDVADISPGFVLEGNSKSILFNTASSKKYPLKQTIGTHGKNGNQVGDTISRTGSCMGIDKNGSQLFSLTSPYAPIRVISSSDSGNNGFFAGKILACYDSLLIIYLPSKKEVSLYAITLAEDSFRLLIAEEDRRRSMEMSMNQSSFLEKSGHSDQSNRSNRSNKSTRSILSNSNNQSQNVSNTSNASHRSGSSGGHSQGQLMSLSGALSGFEVVKKSSSFKKNANNQKPTSRSGSPRGGGGSGAPSPFPQFDPANPYDSESLQSMVVGRKQPSIFIRAGQAYGGNNMQQNSNSNYVPPAGALSMNRNNTSPTLHLPYHPGGTHQMNMNHTFKSIPENSVSGLSYNLDLDLTSDEIKLNTFHNEDYFQYEPELHLIHKSHVSLNDMGVSVATSATISAGELSIGEIEKMFESLHSLRCRVSGTLQDSEGVALNIYDVNQPGKIVHCVILAEKECFRENQWPQTFDTLGLSIASRNVIKVTNFKTKSVAALTVSLSRSNNPLDTTMAIPLYFFHQDGGLNLAYTVGLGACYKHFPIQLEDDAAFIQALIGSSSSSCNANNSPITNMLHISSTTEFIAIQYQNETKIVRVLARDHSGSSVMKMIFFDIFKSFRFAYKSCQLSINGFVGLWLVLSNELHMSCDVMLLMLFAAMLNVPFESCVAYLKTLNPPAILSSETQMVAFSYKLFVDQVMSLKETESCAILSFGLLLLTTQNYRLQNNLLSNEKCEVIDSSISLVWSLASQVDNFQSQALCTAYCGIILANQSYLDTKGVLPFILHLNTNTTFEVMRRILIIPGMKTTFRSLSMTWYFLENILSYSQSSNIEVVSQWPMLIVSAFIRSVNEIHEVHSPGNEAYQQSMDDLPDSLQKLTMLAMQQCKVFALLHWPTIVLQWIGRNDLVANQQGSSKWAVPHTNTASKLASNPSTSNSKPGDADAVDAASDGLNEIIADSLLRFPRDERLKEVCRILKSSAPLYLKLERSPEASELDFRGKQQSKLLLLIRRSLALPTGRGMVTISSLEPLMAEALPIPNVLLSGRVPPNNSIVALDTTNASSDISLWAEFHNGVAAAFRVGPKLSQSNDHHSHSTDSAHPSNLQRITRNWIIYNKTASLSKQGGERGHAGFLLGLGLFGHLNVLTIADICDYLTQGHEPTTIAVLIGVAASKIGTADPLLSKTLCLHLPSLLPAQHWDIEISPMVQCAAIIGLGFLYCRSGHRLIIQFLLEELTRRPTSDRCECRESLALAAAWALGMVLLPKDDIMTASAPAPSTSNTTAADGVHATESEYNHQYPDILKGFADLKIEDRLNLLISGGKRPPQSNLFPFHEGNHDPSAKSSKVMEGDVINVDVTGPAATVAIALIYMRSNNSKVLRRLATPSTAVELDAIRPDQLIYRALAQCIVRWEHGIEATQEWVESQIPSVLRNLLPKMTAGQDASTGNSEEQGNYQGPYGASRRSYHTLQPATIFTAYVHLITGYCLGMGVVYAGTFHSKAKDTLLYYLSYLQKVRDNKLRPRLCFVLDKTLKHMIEMCTCSVSLALGCVMAGSGDVDCLRIMRELRWKVDDAVYGTHMAFGMSLGMLFLAGGKYSLRRDPVSVACLLLSILPRFPSKTTDQQYHLQALRHLYALAVEPRVLHTIDVDTGLPVSVNLEVELKSGQTQIIEAPGLLPELTSVHRIKLAKSVTNRYYSCTMDLDGSLGMHASGMDHLEEDVAASAKTKVLRRRYVLLPTLYVKQIKNDMDHVITAKNKEMVKAILSSAFGGKSNSSVTEDVEEIQKHEEILNGAISKTLMQSSVMRNALLSVIQK